MENEPINKKVEEALESLDSIRRASASPFLFGRIESRMKEERSLWNRVSGFIARPMVALGCIFIILLMNSMVIFLSARAENSPSKKTPELATADEYSQVNSDIYEFENTKP
ncbi:MAG: hypothetical protein KGM98_12120 [Bacteroidota bacterium]|nr:hypothetical protein [Bacteroidota bacterium]